MTNISGLKLPLPFVKSRFYRIEALVDQNACSCITQSKEELLKAFS